MNNPSMNNPNLTLGKSSTENEAEQIRKLKEEEYKAATSLTIPNPRKISFRGLLFLSLIVGAMLPFAFAPVGIYTLAIISVGLLLFFWLDIDVIAKPYRALLLGLAFGIGYFGVGASWIYVSLHKYGFMPMPLAILITTLFILYLSCFPAIQGYCLNKFFPKNNLLKFLLIFPFSFVLIEWLRSWLFSGFPWLLLGESQIDSPLSGLAPIFGVYGVSFAVAFIAGCLVGICKIKKPKIRLILVLLIMALWLSSMHLGKISFTKPIGAPIKVSLVQGNIPQEIKWQPNKLAGILQHYENLTQKNYDSKIIVWPEAAIPASEEDTKSFLKKLDQAAKQNHATIITGIPLTKLSDDQQFSYNALISLGENHNQYLKRHLVPFGEYVPLKPFLEWIVDHLTMPMSGFSAGGQNQPPLVAAEGISIAPFICYEIAYPSLVLDYLPNAQLLLTASDDSWFGRSIAAAQHLAIARMRSLETGRFQLVSTNTGITAIIDDHGKIIAKAPLFQSVVLTEKVQPMEGETPFVRYAKYLRIEKFIKRMF